MSKEFDIAMISLALEQAALAEQQGEVPVGAVLVDAKGNILAASGNNCIAASDPTGHAEIIVLRLAAKKMQNYRLPGTTMYVTLESCLMCAAAMLHARVSRIVYGADDPKSGALHSVYAIGNDSRLNHEFSLTRGVMREECAKILRDFFKKKREKNKIFLSK